MAYVERTMENPPRMGVGRGAGRKLERQWETGEDKGMMIIPPPCRLSRGRKEVVRVKERGRRWEASR